MVSGKAARPGEAGGASRALSVSAAMALAKASLEQVVVTIVGEVSEVSVKAGYKAAYFTVKDDRASLPCMMWMNRYRAAGAQLAVGALVEMTGRFTLYAAKGRMNFDVFSLSLAGEGRLRMQVANLARKLEAEGLMDPARKRPIPKYPEAIGLVTSPRGAAVHDVLRTLRRRYPLARVILAGVPVEGRDAPARLVEALEAVARTDAEVVLLVRGGGSFEDLMPFNDEGLARAIAASPVPVVTGIGHEPDTSIADMVADLRASTPTGAAEAVSPRKENLRQGFRNAARRLRRGVDATVAAGGASLSALRSRPVLRDPQALLAQEALALDALAPRLRRAIPAGIERDGERLAELSRRMGRAAGAVPEAARRDLLHRRGALAGAGARALPPRKRELAALRAALARSGPATVEPRKAALALAASRLEDLSPLGVLARGYAIARDGEGQVVRSVGDVEPGARLRVRVADGEIPCTVDDKEE